jgi:hypothetical protein
MGWLSVAKRGHQVSSRVRRDDNLCSQQALRVKSNASVRAPPFKLEGRRRDVVVVTDKRLWGLGGAPQLQG